MPNRIALVTGASRGIGRAIAVGLAGAGHDVVVNYARNREAADAVVAEVEAAGARALPVQADISIAADRARLVDETLARFGRIDLLVNNAGVAPDVRADLLEATEASFDRLIDINLKGPFFLTQLVARKMIEGSGFGVRGSVPDSVRGSMFDVGRSTSGAGAGTSNVEHRTSNIEPPSSLNPEPRTLNPKVVIISSISAYTASVNRGDYCVAKAGLSMVTKLFAARLAEHGINVYEVRPGIVATDMTGPVKAKYDKLILEDGLTPIRRWGRGDDVARAVVAIATDLLPFSTGEVINVDGGFHLRTL